MREKWGFFRHHQTRYFVYVSDYCMMDGQSEIKWDREKGEKEKYRNQTTDVYILLLTQTLESIGNISVSRINVRHGYKHTIQSLVVGSSFSIPIAVAMAPWWSQQCCHQLWLLQLVLVCGWWCWTEIRISRTATVAPDAAQVPQPSWSWTTSGDAHPQRNPESVGVRRIWNRVESTLKRRLLPKVVYRKSPASTKLDRLANRYYRSRIRLELNSL